MDFYTIVTKVLDCIITILFILLCLFVLSGCGGSGGNSTTSEPVSVPTESDILLSIIGDVDSFILPESDDYDSIPQDPLNPITKEKVEEGKIIFHDTSVGIGKIPELNGTFSCASCHNAPSGFKSGIAQGIGEGGVGEGSNRVLADICLECDGYDIELDVDVQPIASPTIVNVAYQEVMLWNGQFGNSPDGIINAGIDPAILMTEDTPKQNNSRQWSGVETQAAAAIGVHRLTGIEDVTSAAQSMAAYERTVLTNRAPFQKWLRGDKTAMTDNQLKGAQLFFGDAGCSNCHTGPALSSRQYAPADEVFMAVGFADLDAMNFIVGEVSENVRKGRGGFTKQDLDNYKFKIPTLYNLRDTNIFGHGASFASVRQVVEYKNNAIPQADIPTEYLDYRFTPLGLTEEEIDILVDFLENSLYDTELNRYSPQ